jgi:hypothetical protein
LHYFCLGRFRAASDLGGFGSSAHGLEGAAYVSKAQLWCAEGGRNLSRNGVDRGQVSLGALP